MGLLVLLSTLVVFIFQGASADFDNEGTVPKVWKTESDLRRDIFKNYDKLVRPVKNPNNTITTFASMAPLFLKDLDERSGKLIMDSWIKMKWQDDFLQWDPANYEGITVINIPSSEVWKPDIVLYTASPASKAVPEVFPEVLVYNNGLVMWVPPFDISNRCYLPSYKGPRKIVNCILQLGSWTYSGKQMDIQKYGEVDVSEFLDTNPDWELVSMTSDRESKHYACCADDYPLINFNATFKRRA